MDFYNLSTVHNMVVTEGLTATEEQPLLGGYSFVSSIVPRRFEIVSTKTYFSRSLEKNCIVCLVYCFFFLLAIQMAFVSDLEVALFQTRLNKKT